MMEGDSPTDGSGPVSRAVHPHEIAGTNVLTDSEEAAIGPRGWVMHQPTRLLPWGPVPASCWREAGQAGLQARMLSRNVTTEAGTWIVRATTEVDVPTGTSDRERFVVVLDGQATADDATGPLPRISLIHVPAGDAMPAMALTAATTLFVKAGPAR